MGLLAKFENDIGSVTVHTATGGFLIVFNDSTRTENQYESRVFGFGTGNEVISQFFHLRENLVQSKLDNDAESEMIKLACSFTADAIRDYAEKYDCDVMDEAYVATEMASRQQMEE